MKNAWRILLAMCLALVSLGPISAATAKQQQQVRAQASQQGNPIERLKAEPVTLFDLAMFRLESDLFRGHAYEVDWFRRQYKGVEYSLDIAVFWSSRNQIRIHRLLRARANLSNCTIAVETLRMRLWLTKDLFLKRTFWHFGQEAPAWLNSLQKSIVLVGDVSDVDAPSADSRSFYCESGLDEMEVRVLRDKPVYK